MQKKIKPKAKPISPMDSYSEAEKSTRPKHVEKSGGKDTVGKGMVDIGHKKITYRKATAQATVKLSKEAFKSLKAGESPKGDVLQTAKIAGIMGAKNTPNIIPLCHPLSLNNINLNFGYHEKSSSLMIKAEVSCDAKTGAEMEALAACSIAALTVYDMMKWKDKGITISDIKLLQKSGGKSGYYKRR